MFQEFREKDRRQKYVQLANAAYEIHFFHLVTKAYKKDGWRYNEASNTLQHGNKLLLPSVWYPDSKAEDQPARLQQAVWARFFRLATASLLGSLNVHAASVSVRSSP